MCSAYTYCCVVIVVGVVEWAKLFNVYKTNFGNTVKSGLSVAKEKIRIYVCVCVCVSVVYSVYVYMCICVYSN